MTCPHCGYDDNNEFEELVEKKDINGITFDGFVEIYKVVCGKCGETYHHHATYEIALWDEEDKVIEWSYGISICPKCGGEVKVMEGYGGTCYNCGSWLSAGTHDEIQEAIDRENREREERRERMKHVIKIVVTCTEVDDDRRYEWSKEFTNKEEASEWARKQSGCVEYEYYDEKGLIW